MIEPTRGALVSTTRSLCTTTTGAPAPARAVFDGASTFAGAALAGVVAVAVGVPGVPVLAGVVGAATLAVAFAGLADAACFAGVLAGVSNAVCTTLGARATVARRTCVGAGGFSTTSVDSTTIGVVVEDGVVG